VHDRLTHRTAPRLELLLIVSLAGVAAFLTSMWGLRLGLHSMAWRYALAVAVGYGTFLLLIRIWIAWQRRRPDARGASDALDVVSDSGIDIPHSSSIVGDEVPLFEAGRSGGGGGGASFGPHASATRVHTAAGEVTGGIDLDWDELWPLAIAVACVVAGMVAMANVIYTAPVLLAEVGLDAAIMSAVYRRLRREDASHWALTVLRRTWLPALALLVFAVIGGYALQQIAPEARSIGGVMRGMQP
jgi:hypothetical protein